MKRDDERNEWGIAYIEYREALEDAEHYKYLESLSDEEKQAYLEALNEAEGKDEDE